MTNDETNPSPDLLDTIELLGRYRITDSTLRAWIKKFGFPGAALVVNARKKYWSRAAVLEWERSRPAVNTTEAA